MKKLIILFFIMSSGFSGFISSAAAEKKASDEEAKAKGSSISLLTNKDVSNLFVKEFQDKIKFLYGRERYDLVLEYLDVISEAVYSLDSNIQLNFDLFKKNRGLDVPEAAISVIKIIVDCLRLQTFGVLHEYIYEQLKEFEGVEPEKVSLKEPVEKKRVKKILDKAYEELENLSDSAEKNNKNWEFIKHIMEYLIVQTRASYKAQIYNKEQYEKSGSIKDFIQFEQAVAARQFLEILYAHFFNDVEYEENIAGAIQSIFPSPEDLRKSLPE